VPEITERFFAESRAVWRQWLTDNGTGTAEVWLVLNKKHVPEPSVGYDEAVEEAVCFGWIDGIMKRLDDRQYVIRFTPRRPDSRWSESNKARVRKMVDAGLMTEAGMALVEHAKESGEWDEASGSLKDWPEPPELARRLDADPDSREWFDNLAPSHRRQYLGWIYEAKRDDTRLRRIEKTLEMIYERRKPGM